MLLETCNVTRAWICQPCNDKNTISEIMHYIQCGTEIKSTQTIAATINVCTLVNQS